MAYFVYALIAVPLIEPSIELAETTSASEAELDDARRRPQIQHERLKAWFNDGDWELTSPMVIELKRAMVVAKEYKNGDDGVVHLEKGVSVVLLPDPSGKSDEQVKREAIVMQAPGGAILKFDRPLSLGSGPLGNLVGGSLFGRFVIRSDQKQPGPQDDLHIVGHDAELVERRITSKQAVQFRLGPSHGSGKEFRIDLLADARKEAGMAFSGVQSIEIRRDVKVHVDVESFAAARRQVKGEGQAPPPSALPTGLGAQDGPQPPLEITSQGPFQFDMTKYVATFRDQVDVLRLHPRGQSDHLRGDLLSLFFAPAKGETATPGRLPKLSASRIEVRGVPVVMESPQEDLYVEGEFLSWELETQAVKIESRQGASVRRAGSHIRAPKLEYAPSAQSRFGRFSATGPGNIEATPANRARPPAPDVPAQQFRARWTKQAVFAPDPTAPGGQTRIVSLQGDAQFEDLRTGSLAGDEIYVWLYEQPADVMKLPLGPGERRPPALVPERMLANGRVHLKSPNVVCDVDKLQAWFVADPQVKRAPRPSEELPHPAPPMARPPAKPQGPANPIRTAGNHPRRAAASPIRHVTAHAPLGGQQPAAVRYASATPAPVAAQAPPGLPGGLFNGNSQYHVTGHVLQVELRLTGPAGERPELSKLRVQTEDEKTATSRALKTVKVTERFLGAPGGAPLLVVGDQIDYEQTNPLDGKLAVVGEPAHIEGRGMLLEGPQVRMNRATSELDVDGAGQMLLPANQNLDGRPIAQPQPLRLTWQRQMHFQEQVAQFDDQVSAIFDGRVLRTGAMQVTFAAPVNFANPPRQQPQVAEIACRGGVLMDDKTLDEQTGKLLSTQKLQAVGVTVNRITGGITVAGPGTMTMVREGAVEAPGARPAAPVQTVAQTSAQPEFTYVKVAFQTLATGNINHRVIQFGNHVKTVFGPVSSWEGAVDPDDFDHIGANGKPVVERSGVLNSDYLEVAQIVDPATGKTAYALDANGNAELEGVNFQEQSFFARGNHIKYDQSKDLIVLEGDPRTDAELSTQDRVGETPKRATARKIEFWPPTNGRPARVNASDARHLDVTAPPGARSPFGGARGQQPRQPAQAPPAPTNQLNQGFAPPAASPDANEPPGANYPAFGDDGP